MGNYTLGIPLVLLDKVMALAMKAMKKKKAMKVMKTSRRMAKVVAFKGGNTHGGTSLKKGDLVKNKDGKIVSRKKSALAKKRYASGIGKWTKAVVKARAELGVKGFVAIKKGTALYKKAKEIYEQ